MRKISSNGNVYNTALLFLEDAGYAVEINNKDKTWVATSDAAILIASNPIELLGLLYVHRNVDASRVEERWWWTGTDVLTRIIALSDSSKT